MDPNLNKLLKWSIQNSDRTNDGDTPSDGARSGLNEDVLRAIMGGPSDADLMKEAMSVITNTESTHEARMTAFDNFEQLVEQIDNANNMEPLGLWTPLVAQLEHVDADVRKMAAWCIGTAVQNNIKAQERFLAIDGIPIICNMSVNDPDKTARKKAVYALSSSIRNYQPGMNEAVKHLPDEVVSNKNVSAEDMDTIDQIMTTLRQRT